MSEEQVEKVARAIEPKFRGIGVGDTPLMIAREVARAAIAAMPGWRTIDSAPKDQFIVLFCPEDGSRWWAKWQDGAWYGVDDEGLTRHGASDDNPDVVTGWKITHWRPLPALPEGS